jgi:hypothetical protein
MLPYIHETIDRKSEGGRAFCSSLGTGRTAFV